MYILNLIILSTKAEIWKVLLFLHVFGAHALGGIESQVLMSKKSLFILTFFNLSWGIFLMAMMISVASSTLLAPQPLLLNIFLTALRMISRGER